MFRFLGVETSSAHPLARRHFNHKIDALLLQPRRPHHAPHLHKLAVLPPRAQLLNRPRLGRRKRPQPQHRQAVHQHPQLLRQRRPTAAATPKSRRGGARRTRRQIELVLGLIACETDRARGRDHVSTLHKGRLRPWQDRFSIRIQSLTRTNMTPGIQTPASPPCVARTASRWQRAESAEIWQPKAAPDSETRMAYCSFDGPRDCDPQRRDSARRFRFISRVSVWPHFCGTQSRAPGKWSQRPCGRGGETVRPVKRITERLRMETPGYGSHRLYCQRQADEKTCQYAKIKNLSAEREI